MSNVRGLILAAGKSSRMGFHKALLKLPDNQTLLSDQVARLNQSGIVEIFVVVGSEAEKIKSEHKHLKVQWIENTGWKNGNFSSILCGLRATLPSPGKILPSPGGRGLRGGGTILLPIDVAGVEIETIKLIIDEGVKTNHNIIPISGERGGHPVYLRPELTEEIVANKSANDRLDQILKCADATKRMDIGSKKILNNINTVRDWEEFKQSLKI